MFEQYVIDGNVVTHERWWKEIRTIAMEEDAAQDQSKSAPIAPGASSGSDSQEA